MKYKEEKIQLVIGAFGDGEECTGVIEQVIQPESGGIFTKYIGCNYLFKGYPDTVIVQSIYAAKRMISGLFILVSEKWVKFFLGIFCLFFLVLPKPIKKKVLISFWNYFLEIAYMPMHRYIFPERKYCRPVREIYRAFGVIFEGMKGEEIERVKTRDIGCMILEHDTFYRFRVQDVLPELNKKWLKENPRKEIKRIIDILFSREKGVVYKWRGLEKILMFILRFRQLQDFIVKFLLEIDLEKIRFDEADWYYVLDISSYLFGGTTHQERLEVLKRLDEKMNNKRPKVVFEG